MFFISQYFQSLAYRHETSIVWHSIFGGPMLVSSALVEELERFTPNFPISTSELETAIGNVCYDAEEIDETINALIDSHIINVSPEFEQEDIFQLYSKHNCKRQNKVKSLSLIMSEDCQYRCKYCIHFANTRHQNDGNTKMSAEVAKASIDSYISMIRANGEPEAYINFGGGEPLLNWEVIEEVLPYIDQYRDTLDIPIRISLNTNMGLMTKAIARTLIDYDVEIATSLDGLEEGNNAVRLSRNNGGTYDGIIDGIRMFEMLGSPIDGFAMTVTDDNIMDLDTRIIDWAIKYNMNEVRIDVDVVGTVNTPIETIVVKLIKVRQYAKEKGVSVIGFWSRPAENLGLDPEKEDIGFCGGERGNSLCVAPNGKVFPCGYSNYELCDYQHIKEVGTAEAYNQLLWRRNLMNNEYCKNCPILGFCRGGCMITWEANQEQSEKISRMCQLYIAMTNVILCESVDEWLKDKSKERRST